jgi:predicted phage terminase large subunit-like protein
MKVLRPNRVQERFLASFADIAIYGGARGGGKTWALLLEVLRYIDNPGFTAVIFRRTFPQVSAQGGLWDKSFELFPKVGAIANKSHFKWTFPSGATCSFSHLKDEQHKLNWQGAEICYLGFDELTHFTQSQFFFLLASNRSTSGIKPFVRATCNPDAASWVKDFISPWILESGYSNPELSGTVKNFIPDEQGFQFVGAGYRTEDDLPAKSLTFFNADVWDNEVLLEINPEYLTSLRSLPLVERERFLGRQGFGGNWNIKPTAGKVFKSEWFLKKHSFDLQTGDKIVRFWDFGTLTTRNVQKGDFTVGVKICQRRDRFIILDVERFRLPPPQTDDRVRQVAITDGIGTTVRWQQDPGSAGARDSQHLQTILSGFDARAITDYRDKVSRALPFSAIAEAGRVEVLDRSWITPFLVELELFPDGEHDDQVDAASGAIAVLTKPVTSLGKFVA